MKEEPYPWSFGYAHAESGSFAIQNRFGFHEDPGSGEQDLLTEGAFPRLEEGRDEYFQGSAFNSKL